MMRESLTERPNRDEKIFEIGTMFSLPVPLHPLPGKEAKSVSFTRLVEIILDERKRRVCFNLKPTPCLRFSTNGC